MVHSREEEKESRVCSRLGARCLARARTAAVSKPKCARCSVRPGTVQCGYTNRSSCVRHSGCDLNKRKLKNKNNGPFACLSFANFYCYFGVADRPGRRTCVTRRRTTSPGAERSPRKTWWRATPTPAAPAVLGETGRLR